MKIAELALNNNHSFTRSATILNDNISILMLITPEQTATTNLYA